MLKIKIPSQPESSYEVRIGTNLLQNIVSQLADFLPGLKPFIITDSNVKEKGHLIALDPDETINNFVISPAGESSKKMETVFKALKMLETHGYGRDSVILALGGGTVGDLAGFTAAIFKRGIPCIQIPTTTLSQADSAIGGKTGVDSSLTKNAFGSFHNPARVYMDCSTLQTLEQRSFVSGLAETVKHALIANEELLLYLENNYAAILERKEELLIHLATQNSKIKGNVVYQDPFEKNLRKIVNFGHTIGHAIESLSNFEIMHGEAVAIGMVGACRLGVKTGLCQTKLLKRITTILTRLQLPTAIPGKLDLNRILELMQRDKKSIKGVPRFVLLAEVGKVHRQEQNYAQPIATKILGEVLRELGAS